MKFLFFEYFLPQMYTNYFLIFLHLPNCDNSLGIVNLTPRSTVGFSIEKQSWRVYQKNLQCLVQFGFGSAWHGNIFLTDRDWAEAW